MIQAGVRGGCADRIPGEINLYYKGCVFASLQVTAALKAIRTTSRPKIRRKKSTRYGQKRVDDIAGGFDCNGQMVLQNSFLEKSFNVIFLASLKGDQSESRIIFFRPLSPRISAGVFGGDLSGIYTWLAEPSQSRISDQDIS